jgi:hypothetical protein
MNILQNYASVKQFGFLFECCVRVLTKSGTMSTMALVEGKSVCMKQCKGKNFYMEMESQL